MSHAKTENYTTTGERLQRGRVTCDIERLAYPAVNDRGCEQQPFRAPDCGREHDERRPCRAGMIRHGDRIDTRGLCPRASPPTSGLNALRTNVNGSATTQTYPPIALAKFERALAARDRAGGRRDRAGWTTSSFMCRGLRAG